MATVQEPRKGPPYSPACPNCGAGIPPGARFCGYCGSDLQAPPAKSRWIRFVLIAAIIATVTGTGVALALLLTSDSEPKPVVTTTQQTQPPAQTTPPAAETTPGATTPAPPPAPAPGNERGARQYARTASIGTWYTTWSGSYIHFKAVDEDSHKTVMEQPGSDGIDLGDEQAAVQRTPERVRLVNALRSRMTAAGWDEIGTVAGGEWYEYRFGR